MGLARPRSSSLPHARRWRRSELRLKPEHPDIGTMKRRIRDLEQRAEQEALEAPVTKPMPAAEAARQQRVADLQRRPGAAGSPDRAEERPRRSGLRDIAAAYQAAGRCGADPRNRDGPS